MFVFWKGNIVTNGNDRLLLRDLEVSCIIGDLPNERVREQVLRFQVALEMELSAAVESDSLADTVDYAALVSRITATLREAKCRLIEHAAGLVARVALEDSRVRRATVRVEKRDVIPGLGAAVVEITRTREEVFS